MLLTKTLQKHDWYGQGLGATCMYCGDGINDLVALASADVGMSIGSSAASAAASISDQNASVKGILCCAAASQTAFIGCLSL